MTFRPSRLFVIAGAMLTFATFSSAAHAEDPAHAYTIFFDKESGVLTPEGPMVADMAVGAINSEHLARVEVVGHADTAEPAPDALSQQRAAAVRDYLATKGLPANVQITVRAAGSHELKVPTGPGVYEPQNRSVDINLY